MVAPASHQTTMLSMTHQNTITKSHAHLMQCNNKCEVLMALLLLLIPQGAGLLMGCLADA